MENLDDDFIPKRSDEVKAPLMKCGFAMSDQAMLYCARKLDIAPPLELRRPSDGKVVQSYNETDWGYLSLVQMSFLCHLELQASLPCGTITVEECFVPEHRLYALFSNYDLKFKTERARRFKKAKILAILEEIEDGLDGFDGPSPELMWHWDVKKCGFGYVLCFVRQEHPAYASTQVLGAL